MTEFMLLIRNKIDHQAEWPEEKRREFLKKCEIYIGDLSRTGNLLSAQPLERDGLFVSGGKGDWKQKTFHESGEVIVGYYHVLAKDLDDAVSIAKRNPEFEYGNTAWVEIRPVKMKEEKTNFVYPKKKRKKTTLVWKV